jgi:predicted nucleic acid-binding protein
VRYWDASAIVPLVLQEEGSGLARGWLREDPDLCTWGLTRIEVSAAVERRFREGRLSAADRRTALRRFERLSDHTQEVVDLLAVRTRAVPLLARHALRAADAAQLGAALLVAEADPSSIRFVCLDRRLAASAELEGFGVMTWPS